ncbi:polynucleotide adenylyltransferase PcnB [Buchnera aphidicola]|uniref:polynucleotide adenylyltransferase PcnB n=1 Tax=Buchnera aphidicola TaxID=9 RepID=UPI00094D5FAB|nr:polynucleotide adenylyltransferase PcnB [Buchnera aphidicola]
MTLIIKKNHNISHKKISKNSMKVIYRLNKLGYEAYLVGGSVRDLILGKNPKDFDIATNATPEDIKKFFKNCRLIGRRFIIAHLIFRTEIIEVSTFRTKQKKIIDGMLLRDNTFGKIEEDAYRRDLTINALYYNIKDFGIRDYVGGVNDIKRKIICLIGDAETRYREDPVRMLRVIRFSVQLNMKIAKKTSDPISKLANLLHYVPSARLFNEAIKLFCCGHGYITYRKLKKYSLLKPLLPYLFKILNKKNMILFKYIIIRALQKTDKNIKNKRICHASFLFSAILWYPLIEKINKLIKNKNLDYSNAYSISVRKILKTSAISIGIPKNILLKISKIWGLQKEIEKQYHCNMNGIIKNINFLQALELFSLRVSIERITESKKIVQFWYNKYYCN